MGVESCPTLSKTQGDYGVLCLGNIIKLGAKLSFRLGLFYLIEYARDSH
jgi:hypothetical protein